MGAFLVLSLSLFSLGIQLEFYGGLSKLFMKDFNKIAEFRQNYEQFFYQDKLLYLQEKGEIEGLSFTQDGDFKKLSIAIPLGARLRINLTRHISLSAGINYLARQQTSEITVTYGWKEEGQELKMVNYYGPFQLYFKAVNPTLALHLNFPSQMKLWGSGVSFEGFLEGGPVDGEIQALYSFSSQKSMSGAALERETESWQEEGEGKGFCLYAGGRVNLHFSEVSGLFIALRGRYGKLEDLSGSGWKEYSRSSWTGQMLQERQEWEGSWSIKEESFSEEWGEFTLSRPAIMGGQQTGSFKLNLSGFEVIVGIFLRF